MRTGLIGWPLGHSYSPSIHNLAFQMAGLNGVYELFPVEPDDVIGLENTVRMVKDGELQGLNVTIPHKLTVTGLLDELTPIARRVGAVNTIYLQDGKLIGTNTDAPGFEQDLKRHFGKTVLNTPSALVFGAGGSARAVISTLLENGVAVQAAVRDVAKAAKSLRDLAADSAIGFIELDLVDEKLLRHHRLFINTTPLGMDPNTDTSPLPTGVHFYAGSRVYDLVYNPSETKLTKQAVADGCHAATGFGMLVEQALLAFEVWTGVNTDRNKFYARYHALMEGRQ